MRFSVTKELLLGYFPFFLEDILKNFFLGADVVKNSNVELNKGDKGKL